MSYFFGILLFLISLFLILLVLVQRGRGGGLAGAFGGMGGQSAFGTKAGDLFTRITIVVAAVWIVMSVAAIKVLNRSQSVFGDSTSGSVFPGGGADLSEPKSDGTTGDNKTGDGSAGVSPEASEGATGSPAEPGLSGAGAASSPGASGSTPAASSAAPAGTDAAAPPNNEKNSDQKK